MIFLKKLVLTSQVGKINLILCLLQIAVRKKKRQNSPYSDSEKNHYDQVKCGRSTQQYCVAVSWAGRQLSAWSHLSFNYSDNFTLKRPFLLYHQ